MKGGCSAAIIPVLETSCQLSMGKKIDGFVMEGLGIVRSQALSPGTLLDHP